MATDVEELVVRAKPENIDTTTDQLDQMDKKFEETSESMDEQAGLFEEMANNMSGMMGAVVAGLAVAAAGLLSKVPVIGEAMSGLGAIVNAIAFQMDSVLRPALQPVTQAFFGLSNKIFEANGAIGKAIGILATAGAALVGFAVAIKTVVVAGSAIIGAFGTLASVATTVGSVIVGLITTLASLISLPALIIGAFVALATAYIFNIGGMRDKTNEVVGRIWDAFTNLLSNAMAWVDDFISGLVNGILNGASQVGNAASDVVSNIAGAFLDLVDKALGWGKNLVSNFLEGVSGFAQDLIDRIVGAINTVIGTINDIVDSLPDKIKDKLNIGTYSKIDAPDIGGGGGGGATTGRLGGVPQSTGGSNIYLDGQLINENQSRYGQGNIARNGGR